MTTVALSSARTELGLGDWIDASADLHPERAAFVCLPTGRTVSFAESARETGGIARGLREVHGLHAGDRVAVLATDCHLYVELFLACAKLAVTVVPLNYRLPEHELAGFVERSGARLLVVGTEYADLAAQVAAGTGVATTRLSGPGRPEESVEALTTLEPLDGGPCDDDAIFALCFTSGTTGTAKAVRQPQRMLKQLVSTFAIEYEVGDPAEEFRYSASPMFHVAGISIVLLGVARGFPMLVQRQFDAETTRHWMAHGLSNAFLVPTMLRMVLDLPGTREMDFGSLRSILYGASPMTPGLLRECMETFGCGFVNVFGAGTETGLQAVLTSADHRRALEGHPELLGSIGRPPFGVRLRLVDDQMRDVPLGEVGEIATRCGHTMDGYEGMPERTAEAFRDGWFRAGDLARRDADGYLYLAGRSQEMIIRGGENIYPLEVETALMEHPAVGEAAVVGRPDPQWGEVVVAFVRASAPVSPPELVAHCRERLARFKVPVEVVLVEEFPRNASGKVLKRALLPSES